MKDDLPRIKIKTDEGKTILTLESFWFQGGLLKNPQSAYVKFTGEMLEAFMILTDSMYKKGNEQLLEYKKFKASYSEGANELKEATDFDATEYDTTMATQIKSNLHGAAKPNTPINIEPFMKVIVEISGNYLAQYAEFNKDKGPAFKLLVKTMKTKPNDLLYQKEKIKRTYGTAASELVTAKGLESDHEDPNLTEQIYSKLSKIVATQTPDDLKTDMKETLDTCSKYLSQSAVDEIERGPAFDILIKQLQKDGSEPFTPDHPPLDCNFAAAYTLKTAPGLTVANPDSSKIPIFNAALHKVVDAVTPKKLNTEMDEVVDRCSKYLSSFVRDREKAKLLLLEMMRKNPTKEVAKRKDHAMTYSIGATEIESAPTIVPFLPIKDITNEAKEKLTADMKNKTPPDLKLALKSMIRDAAGYLSQSVAIKSGVAGERYPLNFLAATLATLGIRPLYKYKSYGKTYAEGAEELKYAGLLEHDPKCEDLQYQISSEVNRGVQTKLGPAMIDNLASTMDDASKHLSKVGSEKANALEYLVKVMKEEGDAPLGNFQGYQQSYNDGARRIEASISLKNDHVDKGTYEAVRSKLIALTEKKPSPENEKFLPGVVEDSSKFLATPFAESEAMQVIHDKIKKETDKNFNKTHEEAGTIGKAGGTSAAATLSTGTLGEEKLRLETDKRKFRRPNSEEVDPEREAAMGILHKQLQSRGGETLYKQPHVELTHTQASVWLKKPPVKIDKSVKESGDTDRLHKKFEKNLGNLVSKCTPVDMYDSMQDVLIESSRLLSEYFVSSNYKALVREALISEMQKRGNEILIEVDGEAETFFFAAQRLKKAKALETKEPCNEVAYHLTKKLEDMIRCRSMARKLTATMKDYIKDAAEYLSELVTKPDKEIEAYVTLLAEMEATGDALLIEGNISKSYKDSATYLRQLTSFDDRLNRPNSTVQSNTVAKLKGIVANVTQRGFSNSVMNGVIADSTKLLVSYIGFLGEKAEALKVLIEQMEHAGEGVLLRHSDIRKSYNEGVNILRGKNTDHLELTTTDPVITRKIQIKLKNLMKYCTPDKYVSLMDDVIEDATMYLAIHLLQPQVIQVCKCPKNVFVQCELWSDEILRRVARPCCTCSRHLSAQALPDLPPAQRLCITPDSSRAFADISLTQCSSKFNKICPAARCKSGCENDSTTYLFYTTAYNHSTLRPTRLPRQIQSDYHDTSTPSSSLACSISSTLPPLLPLKLDASSSNVIHPVPKESNDCAEAVPNLKPEQEMSGSSSPSLYYTPLTKRCSDASPQSKTSAFRQPSTTLYANIHKQDFDVQVRPSIGPKESGSLRRIVQENSPNNNRTPIISTDQMSDWHAMMVSLMWNVQAWRDWIQENFSRALNYQPSDLSQITENWTMFQRRVLTEAMQWRQYNIFSRQLTLRLALRYKDKQIVSPTRATVKTSDYKECQKDMLEIIGMFNTWTQWLTVVLKETDSLQQEPNSDIPIHEARWNHFKKKVQDCCEDWSKYNTHLKHSWERKYSTIISDWLPSWSQHGPVWVVSAYGAVPCGAVAAGVLDGEVTWVARTTHKCNVLPATLHPSKHCCLIYADGEVHRYTKYQVMCNAEVKWMPWRAGEVGARAVRVAPGVHVGRVHYRGSHLLGAVHAPSFRCHVVIFGRPFAFNCYELLVLSPGDGDSSL